MKTSVSNRSWEEYMIEIDFLSCLSYKCSQSLSFRFHFFWEVFCTQISTESDLINLLHTSLHREHFCWTSLLKNLGIILTHFCWHLAVITLTTLRKINFWTLSIQELLCMELLSNKPTIDKINVENADSAGFVHYK